MRAALLVFVVSLVWLGVNSTLWLGDRTADASPNDPTGVVSAFERSHAPLEVALDARYAGRLELLEPRLALPTWHRHAHGEAVRVHAALATCPPRDLSPIADPVLAKAYEWHARTCSGGHFEAAADQPPYIHPSGRSYAALALAAGDLPTSWITNHALAFHVAELPGLDPTSLPSEVRPLARLAFHTWEVLARGDTLAFANDALVVAQRDQRGLGTLRIYSAAEWNAFAQRAGLALIRRQPQAVCDRPASSELCWTTIPPLERHRTAVLVSTTLSFLFVCGGALSILVLWRRERVRLARERIEALRILVHELRTPATTLRIDVEPLRAAYDELPAGVQDPLLRVSEGVERLHRVIHRSARYMALFESSDAKRERLVELEDQGSIADLFAGFAEEWPVDGAVSVIGKSPDAPIHTDADWLGLALRNLVENAIRHGKAPVDVSWSTTDDDLVIRVADAGSTPNFSLREIAPFRRGRGSAGFGLGLAIVARVARLLGGRLSHEPSPTVFELRVPLRGPT